MSAWQPIETAPKDGSVVQVWIDGEWQIPVFASYCEPERPRPTTTGFWRRTIEHDAPEEGEWRVVMFMFRAKQWVLDGSCGPLYPAEWQPLPAPPDA